MSETLTQAAGRIRRLLRDTEPANYAVDTPFEMYRTIVERAQALSLRAGLGKTITAAYFTSIAGSSADIQLASSTTQMSGIFVVRDETYGHVLEPLSMVGIRHLREGQIATTSSQGSPRAYCIYENASNATMIRLDTIPTVAASYTVENKLLLTNTSSGGKDTSYAAGNVLSFTDNYLRTIEKATALELGQKIPPAELERIGLNPSVFSQWAKDVEDGVRGEQKRKFNTTASPFGVRFFG